MSDVVNEEAKVTNENYGAETTEDDLKSQVQSTIFKILKSKIKGHIYVKLEDKENANDEVDAVYVCIITFGIKYDYRLTLAGKTFDMIKENNDYAKTLGMMIFENYKQYIDAKLFIKEKPFNEKKKFFKKKQ